MAGALRDRLDICKKCEHLNKMLSVCKKCGCIVQLKTKIKSGRKNYKQHYKRIIKNILLTKLYKNNLIT